MNKKLQSNNTQKISKRLRFGEKLIEQGLITPKQLEQALQRHVQVGGRIGSILLEMGFISIENLLSFLENQFNVPSVNLFKTDISQDVLAMLPWEKMDILKVIPVDIKNHVVTLAMENPNDFMTIEELEFFFGKKIKPVVVPEFMIESAIHCLLSSPDGNLKGKDVANLAEADRPKIKTALPLISLLKQSIKLRANDLLLVAGVPPSFKVFNQLKRLSAWPLTPVDTEKYAKKLMTEEQWKEFSRKNDMDLSVAFSKIGRFRTNIFRQRNSISIVMRPIPDRMPTLKELNLPGWIKDISLKTQGLILIAGPTGHGKSTTLYCMIDIINTHRKCNIITFEDPIEYMHRHKKSNVSQREVGRDTSSFHEGLKYVLRQSPDVIVIGEMRDKESFKIALSAATTGHLVISTVHANNSTAVIERVINMFDPHEQATIRTMIADSLIICVSQRLVDLKDGSGRILAIEKMLASNRIKQLIRDDNVHKIRTQMQTGSQDYSPIDASLAQLYRKGLIDFESGMNFADDPKHFSKFTGTRLVNDY